MRRLSYILIAILIGLWGTSLLRTAQGDPRRDVLLLFVAAGAVFVLSVAGPDSWPALPSRRPWPRGAQVLTALSLALALPAVALFWLGAGRDTQFTGLPLWLWLAALLLFVGGTWPEATVAIGATPGDDVSMPKSGQTGDDASMPKSGQTGDAAGLRIRRPVLSAQAIGLILIIFAALFLRVYHIDTFPNGCQSDECNNGMDALRWLGGAPYTPYAETNEGQATLFTYLIALSFKAFGVGVTQMRLVSAVIGTLTIGAFYFLARDWLGWRIALPTAALFAVSRWHLTFSRIVYELILVPLAEILLFYFLLRGLRDGRRRDWALAGLMVALGLNTYTAFRVVPFVVVIFLLYWFVTHRSRLRRDLEGAALLAAAAAVGTAPLGVYVIQHWEVFLSRTQHISVFNDIANAGGSWQPFWDNLNKVLWSLHWQGDMAALNNLPGAPLLDAVTGVLVILGIAYALRYLYRPLPFLSIVWMIVVASVAVLSVNHEAPTARRPIGLLPVIYLLAGLVLERVWNVYLSGWRLPKAGPARVAALQRAQRPFAAALLLLVLYVGATNADTFFGKQAQDPAVWRAYSATEAAIGAYLRDLPVDARIYLAPAFEHHSAVDLLSGRRPYTVLNLSSDLPLRDTQPLPGDVVYVLETVDRRLGPLLQQIYPAGTLDVHLDPYGDPLFLSYRVPAQAVADARGLTGSYFSGDQTDGAPLLQRRDGPLDFDWARAAPPLQPPFSARWQGALLATGGYGQYVFELTSDGYAELTIDDKTLIQVPAEGSNRVQEQPIVLTGGFHAISLVYRSGARPGRLSLAWRGPRIGSEPVPVQALYALQVANSGLVGYYYPNGNMAGQPTVIQRDIFILPNDILPEPFSIVWRGKVAAPQPGQYVFGARADDGALVTVDATLVVDNGGSHGSEYREGSLYLDQGFHDIEIKYWQLGGSRDMQLWWQPPGGTKEIIPSNYLFPIENAVPDSIRLPAPPEPEPVVPPAPGVEPGQLPPLAAAAPLGAQRDLAVTVLWEAGRCGAADGQFNAPHGVAVDAAGNVYVADSDNKRVVKLDAAGNFVRSWGSPGEGDGQFLDPFDLAIAPDGTLVVLDAVQQQLQRFSLDGQFIDAFGVQNTFYRPRGMAIDTLGNVWVADTGGVRVVQLDPAGNLLAQLGGIDQPPVGQGQPTGVALGPGGDIWVAEAASGLIWHLAADGTIVKTVGILPASTLDGPHLAAGPGGTVFATDPENFRVLLLAADGTPVGQFGGQGDGMGQFRKPVGITVDGQGRVLVVDPPACRVTAFAPIQ